MKKNSVRLIRAIAVVLSVSVASVFAAEKTERIVSIGGPVTEIVFALGAGGNVVAVDSSSTYPDAVKKLPAVGYQRMLSAEGVLSVKPGLIVASQEAGPPPVIAQIQSAGVPLVIAPSEHSLAGTKAKITAIAKALGKEKEGAALSAAIDQRVNKVEARLNGVATKPKVVFIYTRGAGALNIAGRKTSADAMIALAGGVNAVTEYDGYKPLTPEALTAAAPDIILVATQGLQSLGGKEGLLQQPGVALTPAGKNGRIVAMDDLLLLGFGPRLGEAVEQLAQALHPQLALADGR